MVEGSVVSNVVSNCCCWLVGLKEAGRAESDEEPEEGEN